MSFSVIIFHSLIFHITYSSYITYPRIHFSGLFDFTPATTNNVGTWIKDAYDTDSYAKFAKTHGSNLLKNGYADYNDWGYRGNNHFSFNNISIGNIYDKYGYREEISLISTLSINKNCDDSVGVLVDIDTENQWSSTLYGFGIYISNNLGNIILSSSYSPSSVRNKWGNEAEGGGVEITSILTNVIIKPHVLLKGLRHLRECSLNNDNKLQIKFTLSGYNFTSFIGKINSGIIGCYTRNEPKKSIFGRYLRGEPSYESYPIQAQNIIISLNNYNNFIGDVLHIDLMNAIPRDINNELINMGNLILKCNDNIHNNILIFSWNKDVLNSFNNGNMGIIDIYNFENNQYRNDFDTCPLIMEYNNTDFNSSFENADGLFITSDKFHIRLGTEYHTSENIEIYGSIFGEAINSIDSLSMISINDYNWTKQLIHNNNCKFLNGKCIFNVKSPDTLIDPSSGNSNLPRWISHRLDSLLYGMYIKYDYNNDNILDNNYLFSVLIFDESFNLPVIPTWINNIQPIFRQYSNLYPAMRSFINLNSYSDVTRKLSSFLRVFNRDFYSSSYMPITRDLSYKKRIMINEWINNPIYDNNQCKYDPILFQKIKTIDELREYLQNAIALEFGVIPLYISAMYSIWANTTSNKHIRRIFSSIIADEMSHIAINANLLISIGGIPKIYHPDIIPQYPFIGLPGGVHNNLKIELKPLTKKLLNDVFLQIESPGQTIDIIDNIESLNSNTTKNIFKKKQTSYRHIDDKYISIKYSDSSNINQIGSFYHVIREGFKYLNKTYYENGENLFAVESSNVISLQLGPNNLRGINYIYNLETAINGINNIVREGEGTSLIDIFDNNDKLSHYHQFLQIYNERLIMEVMKEENNNSSNPLIYVLGPKFLKYNQTEIETNKKAWKWLENNNNKNHQNSKDFRVIKFNKNYKRLLCCLDGIFRKNQILNFQKCIRLMRIIQSDFDECLFPKPIFNNGEYITYEPIAPNWLPPSIDTPCDIPCNIDLLSDANDNYKPDQLSTLQTEAYVIGGIVFMLMVSLSCFIYLIIKTYYSKTYPYSS